jgi:hypothetical protein
MTADRDPSDGSRGDHWHYPQRLGTRPCVISALFPVFLVFLVILISFRGIARGG